MTIHLNIHIKIRTTPLNAIGKATVVGGSMTDSKPPTMISSEPIINRVICAH